MKIRQIGTYTLVLLLMASMAQALTRSEVEKNLLCYACPGEALNIDRCSGGDQMRAEIDRRMALGQDKQTILDFFVERFGDEILTAPPQKGFNLVAYAAPFVALIIGLVVALGVAWKWAAAGKTNQARLGADSQEATLYREMEEQVTNELKKMEDE